MDTTFQVTSGKKKMEVQFTNQAHTAGQINGRAFQLDLVETNTGFHVLQDGVSFRFDVISVDDVSKTVVLSINHKLYTYELKDRFDELLQKMGMGAGSVNKVTAIKAPMPGLVLEVNVKAGDDVTANQPLLILEAMKMENVIKSPSEGKVKAVKVEKGASVEKNQLLIEFV